MQTGGQGDRLEANKTTLENVCVPCFTHIVGTDCVMTYLKVRASFQELMSIHVKKKKHAVKKTSEFMLPVSDTAKLT